MYGLSRRKRQREERFLHWSLDNHPLPGDIRMTVSQEFKSGLSGAIGVSGSLVFSAEN